MWPAPGGPGGGLLSGGGFLALGYTTSLWAFGVLYLLVVTTGANLGFSYALATLINNWFYRRKAFAMSAFQAIDSFVPAVLDLRFGHCSE